MTYRLFLAMSCFAIVFGACRDEHPPPKIDAGVDNRPADTSVPADATPDRQPIADTGADQGPGVDQAGPSPDSPPADVLAADLGPDTGPDAGSPDLARDTTAPVDAGPTCGPGAPRDMLCVSYCDGIGRFCGGANTQFRNADECRAACNAPTWACGQPGDFTGNSLFCRMSHMALAGVGTAATECRNAGPNSPACR